jgi:cyclopropane-fatty-acyl-phospholipid synthase
MLPMRENPQSIEMLNPSHSSENIEGSKTSKTTVKQLIEMLFAKAGVTINGTKAWDILVHDERFFQRVFKDNSLGLGESYMDGWWDCPAIDQMIYKLLEAKIEQYIPFSPKLILQTIKCKLFNFQNKWRSKEVAEKHYDIGNNLYQAMLDKTMNYSCGYWKQASTLEEAQIHKMDLICRKLMLKPGLKLLDIGCGWGGLAKYAAENYGVDVTGVTISAPQKILADELCKGLPVHIHLRDYRDLSGKKFDRIVSVGMFEHVGYKNYPVFMEAAHKNLADDGIFLLHTIGGNSSQITGNEWIGKYIFPNGMLPSIEQIGSAIQDLFIMEDWHNFGVDYDKTLLAWYHNFNDHWHELKNSYGERFYRMWKYYLLSCAAGFRSRKTQLWQIVLTKNGLKKGFEVRT